MKAKNYLIRIRFIALKIIGDQKKVEDLRSKQFNITQQLGGDRVQSSANNRSKDIELVDAIVDLQNIIEDNLISLHREQAECLKLIYSMPDVSMQQVLISYYVDSLIMENGSYRLKTWYDVSVEMVHSDVWCQHLCQKALKEFETIYKETKNDRGKT